MSKALLLSQLTDYQAVGEADLRTKQRFIEYVASEPLCFERSCKPGHLTASAFVVDQAGEKVLLVQHRKLNKWIQPGGHADGEQDLLQVALKELREETGLENVRQCIPGIFDLNIHEIPARGSEAVHLHYDVRFLFQIEEARTLHGNDESCALEWVALRKLLPGEWEGSICRMAQKWLRLLV